MLMALGTFVFSMSTASFNELQRKCAWRHPTSERVGARAARQYLGPGEDTITLAGLVAPELTGTLASLEDLRALADKGEALALVDGTGAVYGSYAITGLDETRTLFFADGVPRRVEFQLSLLRDGDEDATVGGASA